MQRSRRQFLKSSTAALALTGLASGACTPDWQSSAAGKGKLARWQSRRLPPIFERFPKLQSLPWLPLTLTPTPLQPLTTIEAKLGLSDLWIKRDDLTSTLYGGNKARKNEFILADALAVDANHLITVGGIGSHHCCSTAAFGNQLGFKVTLVHSPQPLTPHVREMLLWDAKFQPQFRLASNPAAQVFATLDEIERVKAAGDRPYFIWAGGSTPYGTLSYLNAGLELADQIATGVMPMPEAVYVATGSGGTQAGLTVAFKLLKLPIRVVGVRIVPWPATTSISIAYLANLMLASMAKLDREFSTLKITGEDVYFADGYLGQGYGWPTPASQKAKSLAKELLNLPLEDTYTAKALAAMLDAASAQSRRGPLLFWNTFNSAAAGQLPDVTALPDEYRRLLRQPNVTTPS